MAKLFNLLRVRTASTGTGALILGAAVGGFLTAASAGVQNGDEISYAIRDGNHSEVGEGTVSVSGSVYTLTRTVRKSTNSDAAISLSGNAIVSCAPSAEDFQSDIALGDGTAAAPAIAFYSDDDVGLYRIGANEVGFSVGGAGTGFGLSATAFYPITNDAWSIGKSGNAVADYFGASGHVFNLGAGNYTITHTSGDLAFSGLVTLPNTGLHLLDTNASHDLIVKPGSDLTADRTFTLTTGDADRALSLAGDFSTSGAFALTLTVTNTTNVTLPLTGTLATLAGSEILSNKTLTLPQINDTSADHQYVFAVSELAADRTVTLPLLAGNDTFVFADFIQTLTNKTLTSPVLTTPQINDTSADHQYVFAVSELAADRTVTLPLLAGNDTFVFADFIQTLTNKTLTAPKIANAGFIADANGNELIIFTTTASAVNEITYANAGTGLNPSITASGETNVSISLAGKGTGGVIIGGTSTNDSAAAGKVGEYISASVVSGSAVSLTNVTPANVTSISLTAGDWDVSGNIALLLNAATTCSYVIGAINTTSATLITLPAGGAQFQDIHAVPAGAAVAYSSHAFQTRISLSATTTVYLIAQVAFAINTAAAYGFIGARRVR